jgi:hypothetical protein
MPAWLHYDLDLFFKKEGIKESRRMLFFENIKKQQPFGHCFSHFYFAAIAAFTYGVSKPAPPSGYPQKNLQRPHLLARPVVYFFMSNSLLLRKG